MSEPTLRERESAADEVTCPRCGHRQPAGVECVACGVVFAKVRADRLPAPPAVRQPQEAVDHATAPARPGAPAGGRLAWLVLLLAVAIGVTLWLQAAPPPPPVAATPAPHSMEPLRPESVARPAPAARADADPPESPGVDAPDAVPQPAWPSVEPPPPPAPAAPPSLAKVPFPVVWLEGAYGYEQAMDRAQADGRPVAVYFYTDWCPYCRRLEADVLDRVEVRDYLGYLAKARINPEDGAAEAAIARAYGVTGYPSFFIHSPAGRTAKVRGMTRDGDGWRSATPEEFIAACRRAAGG